MTIHYSELAPQASRDPSNRLRLLRRLGITVCGAVSLCACSSAASDSGASSAGSGAAAGEHAGGATAAGGASAMAGATTTGGTSAGGGTAAGAGGTQSGGGGAGMGGAAGGASSAGSGGVATGGTGGAGGSSGGASGAADCAGHALSLSANTTGADPAAAHVEVDLGSDLPIGNAARTVELWAYMKSADWSANVNSLFFYGIANNGKAPGFGLDFGNTTGGIGSIDPFTNGLFDNDNQASGVTVATSQWVHFAMVWDPTSMSVLAYVNGVLKSTKVSDGTQKNLMTGTSLLTIGGYPIENAYFADYIDEFRVWNVTRSATDINTTMKKALVGNEAGLVGYWQFNEASGTTAADSVTTSGHTAHVGMLKGNPSATFALPNPESPVSCP